MNDGVGGHAMTPFENKIESELRVRSLKNSWMKRPTPSNQRLVNKQTIVRRARGAVEHVSICRHSICQNCVDSQSVYHLRGSRGICDGDVTRRRTEKLSIFSSWFCLVSPVNLFIQSNMLSTVQARIRQTKLLKLISKKSDVANWKMRIRNGDRARLNIYEIVHA